MSGQLNESGKGILAARLRRGLPESCVNLADGSGSGRRTIPIVHVRTKRKNPEVFSNHFPDPLHSPSMYLFVTRKFPLRGINKVVILFR